MLNRKTSNYLFYGTLALILIVTLVIRFASLGAINEQIQLVTSQTQLKQNEIDSLKTTVQDSKEDAQVAQLFELYNQVPDEFDQTLLTYFTIAQLELVGISEDSETLRTVTVEDDVTFPVDSDFSKLQEDFMIVNVEVYFNTITIDVVDEFVDLLYESEQVFVVNSIEYFSPDGQTNIGVTINFLAFYEKEAE